MCKNIFKRKIYVRSKFSCMRSSHDLCARAHAQSLEGTLLVIILQSLGLNFKQSYYYSCYVKTYLILVYCEELMLDALHVVADKTIKVL